MGWAELCSTAASPPYCFVCSLHRPQFNGSATKDDEDAATRLNVAKMSSTQRLLMSIEGRIAEARSTLRTMLRALKKEGIDKSMPREQQEEMKERVAMLVRYLKATDILEEENNKELHPEKVKQQRSSWLKFW